VVCPARRCPFPFWDSRWHRLVPHALGGPREAPRQAKASAAAYAPLAAAKNKPTPRDLASKFQHGFEAEMSGRRIAPTTERPMFVPGGSCGQAANWKSQLSAFLALLSWLLLLPETARR
jgi:hypothetical protein